MLLTRNDTFIRLQSETKLQQYQMYVADNNYFCPTFEQLAELILGSQIDYYKYRSDTFDCDDFSLILHAFVRQCQYDMAWPNPWLFGEVFGNFRDIEGHHARNFCITSDRGFVLPEPQNDRIYLRDPVAVYSLLRC